MGERSPTDVNIIRTLYKQIFNLSFSAHNDKMKKENIKWVHNFKDMNKSHIVGCL